MIPPAMVRAAVQAVKGEIVKDSAGGGNKSGVSNKKLTKKDSSHKPWLFALIPVLGIPLFCISRKNNKSVGNSRNAKAMNLFMKYSK